MIRTLRYLLLFVFTCLSAASFAQGISGRVFDEKKEPMINAVVQVFSSGGVSIGGNVTDFDGNYLIKPLEPGYYNVLVRYSGYDSMMITGVVVHNDAVTTLNFNMKKPQGKALPVTVFVGYKKPLVNVDDPGSHVMTSDELNTLPSQDVTDAVSLSPGLYQPQRGKDVNIGGARTSGTTYMIDGVMVQGTTGINMSQSSIDQLEVITSGIPANYGDVSGGIVNITTRGAAPKLTGDFRVQHSIDGYNNNLVSFSIAGPVFKKKIAGDSTHAATKKNVLGFSLSGDFYDDHDRYPDYDEQYVIKGSSLNTLLQNPLHIGSDNAGDRVYNYASEYISINDLQKVRIPPNNVTQEARLNGKLDYQVADNMRVVAGGTFDYTKQDLYSRYTDLFASSGTPVQNTLSGRGFIRFTQKFGKAGDTSGNHSIISNAYYTVQADYQKLSQITEDPTFKDNMFDYAYNGVFKETRQNLYQVGGTPDSASGRPGTILQGSASTGISYTPSNLNPNLSAYTKEYYNSLQGGLPLTIQTVQFFSALANGDEPNPTYTYNGVGLFASPGTTQNYYLKFNSNQYALTVDASFDLLVGKTKHAIGFGLYYQQRIEKQFYAYGNAGGINSLWSLMRGLVSSIDNGNLKLDKSHPIFVVNGVDYTYTKDPVTGKSIFTDPSGNVKNINPGPSDTIIYNYQNIGNSAFDQALRKKLGLNSTQDINIDALAPSTFSLNMFSADELLNSGNPYVGYYGYTYTGGEQTGTVNFNDFWTKKDANGNYTRPIGAFSPNYIAGYLMDNFIYKDIHFNIGVRIDRYSANDKVLIDPYSLYPETNVGQNSIANNPNTANGKAPSNIPGNAVVYVDDNNSSAPTVIGYRSGNNWYDPTGKYIEDPSILKTYSGGRDPQPLIQSAYKSIKITDTNFNPNLSFTDYNPSITVMPRLSFSFPISDVADFYAHYDIYAQHPNSNIVTTPYDYYYLNQNSNQAISNPNLKQQQTFDYEVGFQQKLSSSSALLITAFYKERKNMIALIDYLYAWPTTYYTYGNRDFSTTKGSTLQYDLRATNHLSMTLSYTLQFAEGTGSTPGPGKGLLGSFIEAGLPNLRYITPLDYDSRHNIVGNINYRYKDGEGPMIGGLNILQNAGLDLIARARSGEPYTAYSDPLGNTIIGGVNGSRLPWHFGMDLRVDKDFALAFGKKRKDAPEGVKIKKPLFIKAIVQVNNLLNTRDIISVYGYTGKSDDNGYLASAYGKQFVPQQINPATYSTLYSIYINDPAKLNYARTISLALQFNF